MSENITKAVQAQDQSNSMKSLLQKILLKLDGAVIMLKVGIFCCYTCEVTCLFVIGNCGCHE